MKRVTKITRLWGWGISKIIGMNIKIHGDPEIIGGGIIVANHQSYLDIIAHASVFHPRFTPKVEIASWPVLGWILGINRPVWVDRKSKQSSQKTLVEYRETLEHGINLIVYPEGTSSEGAGILPFKSTPFEAVSSGNHKIYPVLIRYIQKPGEPTLCWYGDMTLLPHCWYILGRPSINVEIHMLDPILPEGRNRKELARFVHDYMEKKYNAILCPR
ncbi:MAG: 1-acyl-sn-glycerol-3-phosphate acyltransferase [Lentisphaerae bacterium]|nr:1-acyl-sn-glycerol-3-phosphate acyltransferase [Lentisphaerota bacterium]